MKSLHRRTWSLSLLAGSTLLALAFSAGAQTPNPNWRQNPNRRANPNRPSGQRPGQPPASPVARPTARPTATPTPIPTPRPLPTPDVTPIPIPTALPTPSPTPRAETEIQLTLDAAIRQALKANLGLQIQQLQPEISRQDLLRLLGQYGLSLGINAQLNQDVSPSSTSFIQGVSILNQLRQSYDVFLDQELATGGSLKLDFTNGILSTNSTRVDVNPAITPQIALDIRHPLLRNTFNGLRQIDIQENQVDAALWNLKQQAIDTVADVQSAYWNLVLYRERLSVLQQSLQILEDLLNMNQEKEKAGFMSRIDVLQTEARIASSQANLIDAQRNVENTEDQLKQLLNPDTKASGGWSAALIPADKPEYKPYTASLDKSYQTALTARPDLQSQVLELYNSNLREQIAAQNLLPQLDFTGRSGLESLDSNYPSALGKLFSFQTYFWQVGLAFQMPVIGNSYAAIHDQSQIQRDQQKLRIDNSRQQILRDLRQAVRNLESIARQVDATRLAKTLAEEQLKAQTEKLNLGQTTNFQVLQFQTDFVQASLDEVSAIVQYMQAINRLQQTEGTLLEAQNIRWATPAAPEMPDDAGVQP